MSLRDAVLEIAEQMESEASAVEDIAASAAGSLRSYAGMIRLVVKASGNENGWLPKAPEMDGAVILSAHGCNPDGPAKAMAKLQEAKLGRAAENEDRQGVRMVEILDGSNDGLCEMHQVPMTMQVGQAIDVGRKVFVLTRLDNGTLQLHLHAEETARRFGTKEGGK